MAIKGNFFAVKREWSKLKDQILDHYLSPVPSSLSDLGCTQTQAHLPLCFAGGFASRIA
jgi:hypothetical protein